MLPARAPQSAEVCIQAGSSLPFLFAAPFYQIGYFLSFQYLEVEVFENIKRLAKDSFFSDHSSHTYSFFLVVLDWNSSHSSCILGCNFHSENLVGVFVSESYNCDHSHAMESITSITGSDMLV